MSHLGIFESIEDLVFVTNTHGNIVETNRALSTTLGTNQPLQPVTDIWPEIADIWESSLAAANSGKQLRVDVSAMSVDGRELIFDVRTFAIDQTDSSERLIVAVARDVTAERKNAKLLEIQATTDGLTSVYNKTQLAILLSQSISSAQRRKVTGCFLFIDVDKLKIINDDLGHDEGDRVLREISKLLQETLRDSDIVGRLGGDEFRVILTDASKESGAMKAHQIANVLNSSITIDDSDNATGLEVSIGLAVFPESGDYAKDVIKRADTAMYRAKKHPGSSVEVWER